MNKIKSKQTGQNVLSPLQTAATVGLVLLGFCISLLLYFIGVPAGYVIILSLFIGGVLLFIFFFFIFDKERFGNIIVALKFKKREIKGDAKIHLFRIPLDKLKKHIPIEEIYENGLIEYCPTKNIRLKKVTQQKRVFGALLTYDPPSVPESHEEKFHKAIERIVNVFGSELEVSFHFYDMIDRTNPLADQILKAMNTPGKTLQQKQHLHGMYEDVTNSTTPRASSRYLISIKLGKFKSADHAIRAYHSIVPGILKSLQEQGIYTMQVVGENAIAIELRTFATMEEY